LDPTFDILPHLFRLLIGEEKRTSQSGRNEDDLLMDLLGPSRTQGRFLKLLE
jgi:hypothetical protein